MPPHQHVEGGHGKREARLTIRPAPMHDLFEMAHERQHGEHRLDEQTVLPRAARTQCERARIALGGMAGGLTQDNHLVFTLPHSPLQGGIRDMRGGTRPPPNQPPLRQEATVLMDL